MARNGSGLELAGAEPQLQGIGWAWHRRLCLPGRLSGAAGAALVALVVCVMSATWAVSAAVAAAPVSVKVGAVLPLSGAELGVGQAEENGALLALDQANSANLVPGVRFTLVPRSDVGAAGVPDGATGAAQVRALIADAQVAGFVGPSDTATALSELPLANRAPLAAVSPSAGDTCLTVSMAFGCTGTASELATVQPTGLTTLFRVAPSDVLQTGPLADFASNSRRYHTAVVIDDATPVGAGQAEAFAARFKEDGGAVVGTYSVAPTSSYLNLLTAIAALKPDVVVYLGATNAQAGLAVRQQMLQIPGLANTPLISTALLHTTAFAQAIFPAGGPVYTSAPEPQLSQLSSAAAFAGQYQTVFGPPSTDAARGFDSAEALLHAIKTAFAAGAKPPTSATANASAFREAVISALRQTTFTGADGPIAFAPNGDLQQGPVEIDALGLVAGSSGWTPVTVAQVMSPAPTATLTPGSFFFGSVPTHGGSATTTVTVTNSGAIPFGVASVSVSGSGFKLRSMTCSTKNLIAGAGCVATVRFKPPSIGKFAGTVAVSDPASPSPQTFELTGFGVNPATLAITTAAPRRGAVGVPYTASLSATGGVMPYRWSLASGTLPGGLTLNAQTGALSGTPTRTGTFTSTLKVTDSATTARQTTTKAITVTIAPPVPAAVYVVNGGNSAVHAFSLPPGTNPSPLITIAGPATLLNGTSGVALDATGGVYVANSGANTITEYAPGANGNAMPSAVLAGPDTGLYYPAAVALDSDGFLYVANQIIDTITVYAPGASGDATPVRTITGLSGPDALTVDAAGDLWVAEVNSNTIARYPRDATGDATPLATITGADTKIDYPRALALDQSGHVLVANEFADSITIYPTTANGDSGPVGTISGTNTELDFPVGLDVDARGNIYVANTFADTITVYPAGTLTGRAPMAIISGPATGLANPGLLAVTPPLTILTKKLPHARAGHRYRIHVWAAFGRKPYRWSLRAGRLPRGLHLNAKTGEILGTPRHSGTASIRLKVVDHTRPSTTATRALTLAIKR